MVNASLNNYRQSPRKVRLVAQLVKGKSVDQALAILNHTAKRSTGPLSTLVRSAVANAQHNFKLDKSDLMIKDIRVDAGQTLRRSMPRARGSAYPIRKRTSRITLVLDKVANK
jgi:large subunit ribosomal protein L22